MCVIVSEPVAVHAGELDADCDPADAAPIVNDCLVAAPVDTFDVPADPSALEGS